MALGKSGDAPIVTLFGGTGFLGRRIAHRLAGAGWQVRVAARRPERMVSLEGTAGQGRITTLAADLCDDAAVARAVAGADATVNAVGLYVERGGETFRAVHVDGARSLARRSAEAGVTRLVHISGIGVDPASPSPYVRARAEGEAAVRDAFAGVTILRPSVLFGPEDAFFNSLAGIARLSPVLPLFGDGTMRLQPVYVDDVARAVVEALAAPAAKNRVYELGGPRAYSYRALWQLLLGRIGRRRLLLPLPFAVWEALAAALRILPNPPLTRDQIELMRRDNLPDEALPGLADLGITPRSVEEILPRYPSDQL